MRVLLVSIGDEILRDPGGTVAERLEGYATRAGEVVQLTYSAARDRHRPARASAHLRAYPTRSANRLDYFVDGLAAGRRLLAAERFDLIETQDPVAAGAVGVALAERFGVPLLLGCHNDFYGSRAWLTETPRNLLEYALARWSLTRCDGLRAVSTSLRDSALRLGLPPERVGVAPVPVDRGLYARGRDLTPARRGWDGRHGSLPSTGTTGTRGRQAAERRGSAGRILFAGRIAPQKDVPTLLRAVARLAEGGRDVGLDVVGAGREEEGCRALAARLGIGRRVTFHRRVGPEALSEHYWRCDVFASPARYEGFGRVLVEAALHGAPVVATRVGGVPDIVAEGQTGALVAPADPEALARAIAELLDDPGRARRLAQTGWERAVARFDPERQSDQVVQLWRRIAALGRRR